MWIYIFLTYLLNVIATVLSKEFALTNKWWFVAAACISAALSSVAWAYGLQKGIMLIAGTPIISVSLMISIVLIGFFYYQEPLGLTKIMGICFGIIGIILILK